MSLSIFSSNEYYKNKSFIRLMREWRKIDDDDYQEQILAKYDDGEELLEQMYENVLYDFLVAARFWLESMQERGWAEGQGLE